MPLPWGKICSGTDQESKLADRMVFVPDPKFRISAVVFRRVDQKD
jgi:hypothetical protein